MNYFPNSFFTDVDTTKQHELGLKAMEVHKTYGPREWIYVFNDAAALAFSAGEAVRRVLSGATEDYYGCDVIAAAAVVRPCFIPGVAQHAIAAGEYGWILNKGIGLIRSGTGDMVKDTEFTTGGVANQGSVVAVVANADATTDTGLNSIGHTIAAIDESASETGYAWIDCSRGA